MSDGSNVSTVTALAPVLPTGAELGVLKEIATAMAASDMGFLPDSFKGKPQACLALCLTAHAYGVHPMLAAPHAYVIKGKVAFEVAFKIGVVKSRVPGFDLEVLEWTDDICRVRGTRPGRKPFEDEFTYAKAVEAGLTTDRDGKPTLTWKAYRRDLLYNRAAGRVVQRLCPDALLGLPVFDEDRERGDEVPAPAVLQQGEPTEAVAPREESVATVVEGDDVEEDWREMALAVLEERGFNRKHGPTVRKLLERVLAPYTAMPGNVPAADWKRFYEGLVADTEIRREGADPAPAPAGEKQDGAAGGLPDHAPRPLADEPPPPMEPEEVADAMEPPTHDADSTPEGFIELCREAEVALKARMIYEESPGKFWFVALETLRECGFKESVSIHRAGAGVLSVLAGRIRARMNQRK